MLTARSISSPELKTESSDIFIIATEEAGTVVLKASRWYQGFAKDPKNALENVYEVISELSKQGISIQKAFKNRSGFFVTEGNGPLWTLLNYISGNSFSGGGAEWRAAGEALGHFHKAGRELMRRTPILQERIKKNIPVEKPYEESREMYFHGFRETLLSLHTCEHELVCRAVRDSIPILDKTIEYIEKTFKRTSLLTISILHNDFNRANGLFAADGSFAGFLDADQLGVGPCVYDIGNTLASFSTEFLKKGTLKEFQERTAEFLKAYNSVFSLPENEYLLILAATERWDIMRVLRTMHRHYFENNRLPELLPKVAKRLLPRIEKSPEIFSFITESWVKDILA